MEVGKVMNGERKNIGKKKKKKGKKKERMQKQPKGTFASPANGRGLLLL